MPKWTIEGKELHMKTLAALVIAALLAACSSLGPSTGRYTSDKSDWSQNGGPMGASTGGP